MCGIAGILNFGNRCVEPEKIGLMTDLMYHRGPDDYGYAYFGVDGQPISRGRELQLMNTDGPMAFGHRRLSIIDLAETGSQPMSSRDGRCWICYNGEIYNYVELREELINLDYSFAGTSDTEGNCKSAQPVRVDSSNHHKRQNISEKCCRLSGAISRTAILDVLSEYSLQNANHYYHNQDPKRCKDETTDYGIKKVPI